MDDERPVVLVVEDEADLAELYGVWLEGEYEVRIATSGEEALEAFDDDVAVALLDRRMPDTSGDEVLDAIRAAGGGCRVAMVTAVEPDYDVLDLGFDDYLRKPVERDQLRGCVERLLALAAYDRELQEYYALLSKRAALEAAKSADDLAASGGYAALVEEIERRREAVDARRDALSQAGDEAAFRSIGSVEDEEP